jgi:hypothetical protein
MWATGNHVKFAAGNGVMGPSGRTLQRHRAVGVAVDDQRRYRHLGQVVAEVGAPRQARRGTGTIVST